MKKKDFNLLNNKVISIDSSIFLINGSDVDNALSIIKMLNFVEKDGWMVDLRIALDEGDTGKYLRIPGEYEAFICYDQEKASILYGEKIFYPQQVNY